VLTENNKSSGCCYSSFQHKSRARRKEVKVFGDEESERNKLNEDKTVNR